MSALLAARLLPAGVAVVLLLAGCARSVSPTATQTATSPTSAPSVEAATPAPTATSAPTFVGGGHVIHVNLAVPLASATALGSACDAATLRATGPKVATIPGSRLWLADFDQARMMADQPHQTNAASATREPITTLGEQWVPKTGTVVKPISDGSSFPAACLFSFDVPTTAVPDRAYLFAVGSIYFPIPLMLRADLEATDWVANIGVNPQ